MQKNYNKESQIKGDQFERYVEEIIFPEAHYELIYKTSDGNQNFRRYARKSMEPDFQFRCRVTGKEFHIEAKWRAKPYMDKYQVLSGQQFNSFPNLHSEAIPIFVVFGYGGLASDPDYVSFIPLKAIEAPYISPAKVHSFSIEKTYYPNNNFFIQENKTDPKPDNSTTAGNLITTKSRSNNKVLGLAAIGLVAILLGIYSFMISVASDNITPPEKLQEIVADYYQSMNSNQIEKLPEYLSSNVDSWYGAKGMSTNQILRDAKNHRGTYPYSSSEIDWNTFQVINQVDGGYLVAYDMIYKRKKNIHDDYKVFNLHLITTWNNDFKMKSIREIRN